MIKMNDQLDKTEQSRINAIEQAHCVAEGKAISCFEAMVAAGELLIEERKLHEGTWVSWCESNLSFSIRTAQTYIRAAEILSREGSALDSKSPITTLGEALVISSEARQEDQDKKRQAIIGMALDYKTTKEIAQAVRASETTVQKIKNEYVIPQWLERDWTVEVLSSPHPCKEMHAARIASIIAEHRKADKQAPPTDDWTSYAKHKCSQLNGSRLSRCKTILARGCDALIRSVEMGELSPAAAQVICKKPHDEQRKEVEERSKTQKESLRTHLEHVARRQLDMCLGIKQEYPNFLGEIGSLERECRLEMVNTFESVVSKLREIVTQLKKEKPECHLPHAAEPKTSSNGSDVSSPTNNPSSSPISTQTGPRSTLVETRLKQKTLSKSTP